MAKQEDIRPGDKVPGQRSMNLLKWAGVITPTIAAAYVAIGVATGDWDLTDGIQNLKLEKEPIEPETPEEVNNIVEEKPDLVTEKEVEPAPTATQVAATAAAPCATDEVVEEVKEKVCVGPKEELVATADSSCDGIISLTREALWGNAEFITPEMVANIENPLVKAVYQALLDGDRSALTTALTNLYADNGAFNPENATGVLDGLKDSIIIYPGDQIVIDENGWTLIRKGGDEVPLVDCEGKLLNVDEKMSDTGKCGDKIIPVSELPKEDVASLCDTGSCDTDGVKDVSKEPAKPLTEAEVERKLSGLSPEAINAYDNSVLSPELKERLIETNTAVLANLESDSTGELIPFLVTDSGKPTLEDLTAAARNGYYTVQDGAYVFNVQEVGPDGLKRPYCIEVDRKTFELLRSGGYGESLNFGNGTYFAIDTPGSAERTVVTDFTESGRPVRTGDIVEKDGEKFRVLNVKDWEAAIQRDATFRDLKTT